MVKLLRGFFVAPSPWQVRDLAAVILTLMHNLHFSDIAMKKESAQCVVLRSWQVGDLAADMVALMQHVHFSDIALKKESAQCVVLRLHLDRRPQSD